jgi:hypothetical protein
VQREVDVSGPCDEAEHAGDPRCSGAGVEDDDDDQSGPGGGDDDRRGGGNDDEDRSGSNSGRG